MRYCVLRKAPLFLMSRMSKVWANSPCSKGCTVGDYTHELLLKWDLKGCLKAFECLTGEFMVKVCDICLALTALKR